MHAPSELLELARRIENGDTTEDCITEEQLSEAIDVARQNGRREAAVDAYNALHPDRNAPDADEQGGETPTEQREHITEYERDMIVAALRRFAVERETEINAERFLNG